MNLTTPTIVGQSITNHKDCKVEFRVGDKIIYIGKYEAEVIKLHPGYNLVRIKMFAGTLTETITDVSTVHCKIRESK